MDLLFLSLNRQCRVRASLPFLASKPVELTLPSALTPEYLNPTSYPFALRSEFTLPSVAWQLRMGVAELVVGKLEARQVAGGQCSCLVYVEPPMPVLAPSMGQ